MIDFYEGHTFFLKTRLDKWMRIIVIPVEYGSFVLLLILPKGGMLYSGGLLIYLRYMFMDLTEEFVAFELYKKPPDPVIFLFK